MCDGLGGPCGIICHLNCNHCYNYYYDHHTKLITLVTTPEKLSAMWIKCC